MDIGGAAKAQWREDLPISASSVATPWREERFDRSPQLYMAKVLETVRPYFRRDGKRLIGDKNAPWWIAPWMDYSSSGREPLMGLTRERGPDDGDLSETSKDGSQVWAVGFYNALGAMALGEIFSDPCDPSLPVQMRFPSNTVSIKFLFTDASPDEVKYLSGAPTYRAMIDPPNAPRDTQAEDRIESDVRLLQLDIAIKDNRATETNWVFGTFAWIGPSKGDGLFDNLIPVSLQWGNDPKEYGTNILESWVNPDLRGVLYGWDERPTLGFNGRANGPADNIRSSCLSCHAAARIPRSSHGLVGFAFDMKDIGNPEKVKSHVDLWFQNHKSNNVFTPDEPVVSTLDYSLQLDAGIFRMCTACRSGDMYGETPSICRTAGFYNRPHCAGSPPETLMIKSFSVSDEVRKLRTIPPPRQ
jgi:hypothetical protein